VLTAKCLYKYKIPVYGFDYNENHSGFKSKLLRPFKCPDPKESSSELLSFLIKKAESLRVKPVLIPASDEYVTFVNENRKELEKCFTFLMPSYETINKFINKGLQLNLAKENGLDVPAFYNINSVSDIEDVKDKLVYPCILKPYRSTDKQYFNGKVTIIKDRETFNKTGCEILLKAGGFIAQEIVEGNTDKNFEVNVLYINKDNIFSHVVNKIRQFPDEFGTGCMVATCQNEYLENITRKFVQDKGVFGFSNTEFKYSVKDGKYYFVETNIRVWQQIDITMHMQNYVKVFYDYCSENITLSLKNIPYRRIKWVEAVNDFQIAHKQFSRGDIGLTEWIKSYSGKKTFGMLSRYETRLFLKEIQYGKKILNYLVRKKNV
jgi:predicted ATP-grasp superfamily ATP-dependent carboligase